MHSLRCIFSFSYLWWWHWTFPSAMFFLSFLLLLLIIIFFVLLLFLCYLGIAALDVVCIPPSHLSVTGRGSSGWLIISRITNYTTSHFRWNSASNACGPEMQQKEHPKIIEILALNLSCVTLVQVFHVLKTENIRNINTSNESEPRRCLTAWHTPSVRWFHLCLIKINSTKATPCEKERSSYGRLVGKCCPQLVSNVPLFTPSFKRRQTTSNSLISRLSGFLVEHSTVQFGQAWSLLTFTQI